VHVHRRVVDRRPRRLRVIGQLQLCFVERQVLCDSDEELVCCILELLEGEVAGEVKVYEDCLVEVLGPRPLCRRDAWRQQDRALGLLLAHPHVPLEAEAVVNRDAATVAGREDRARPAHAVVDRSHGRAVGRVVAKRARVVARDVLEQPLLARVALLPVRPIVAQDARAVGAPRAVDGREGEVGTRRALRHLLPAALGVAIPVSYALTVRAAPAPLGAEGPLEALLAEPAGEGDLREVRVCWAWLAELVRERDVEAPPAREHPQRVRVGAGAGQVPAVAPIDERVRARAVGQRLASEGARGVGRAWCALPLPLPRVAPRRAVPANARPQPRKLAWLAPNARLVELVCAWGAGDALNCLRDKEGAPRAANLSPIREVLRRPAPTVLSIRAACGGRTLLGTRRALPGSPGGVGIGWAHVARGSVSGLKLAGRARVTLPPLRHHLSAEPWAAAVA